jgi:hypothetical protein
MSVSKEYASHADLGCIHRPDDCRVVWDDFGKARGSFCDAER